MKKNFYGVKTIYQVEAKGKPKFKDQFFKDKTVLVEERIVLFKASNHDQAIKLAKKEAIAYSSDDDFVNRYGQKVSMKYMGIYESFELYDIPGTNAEVFSSTRAVKCKLTKSKLADLFLGKIESKKDLKYRRKFFWSEVI